MLTSAPKPPSICMVKIFSLVSKSGANQSVLKIRTRSYTLQEELLKGEQHRERNNGVVQNVYTVCKVFCSYKVILIP